MHSIERALGIALEAHGGQVDKAGEVYMLHPLRLMMQAESMDEMLVALLHDVVEDSETSFDDLVEAGFGEEVVEAVRCLTKEEGVTYEEYLKRVKANPLARVVKLLDLKDNMNLSRLPRVTEEDWERRERYEQAYRFLEE